MEKLYGTLRGEGTLTGQLTTAKASVSISVDSDVTTGEPGTAARVDNLGTNRDAILKFTIPQGPRGEKGETGNPGQDGKDGNDGPMGPQGNPGSDGTTFTPQVSSEGVISWTNDGGKENPEPVNIKGPAGQNGQDGEDGERGFGILSVTTPPTYAGVKSTINPQDEDVSVSINDTIQYEDNYVYLVTDSNAASLKTAYELHDVIPYPDWQQVSGPSGQVFGWAVDTSQGTLYYTAISPDASEPPQEGDVVIVNGSDAACVVVDYGTIEIDGVNWEYLHVEENYGINNELSKSAPVDCYIPVATVKIQAGVDEVLVGDIVKYNNLLYKVNSISGTNANLDEPQDIKGADGTNGTNGERGFSILSVTTEPTAYSGTIFGKTYTYRIPTATVKTQAGVTKGLAGDIIKYNTNLYPVVYANSSYLYMTDPTDIQGPQGPAGNRGGLFLKVTTSPSSYTTTTGGFKPSYRILVATVKTQSGASDVQVGDIVCYSYYQYSVGYVDSSYAYLSARTNIQGPEGPQGEPGTGGGGGTLIKVDATPPSTDTASSAILYKFVEGGSWTEITAGEAITIIMDTTKWPVTVYWDNSGRYTFMYCDEAYYGYTSYVDAKNSLLLSIDADNSRVLLEVMGEGKS